MGGFVHFVLHPELGQAARLPVYATTHSQMIMVACIPNVQCTYVCVRTCVHSRGRGKKTFVNLSSLVPDVSSPLSVHVHVSTLVTLASFRVIGPPIYMYVRLPE